MRLSHFVKKENSGLMRSALELAHWEERLGHSICIREPSTNAIIYGEDGRPDVHVIHSQLHQSTYSDGVPKIMLMHGEPLSSVSNKVSMRAIVDLSPLCDAFICMRQEELLVWKSIKRATFRIPKGVDLEVYRPLEGVEKLAGSPAVLYCENWRGERNPLYLAVAMSIVVQKLPDARLHLYNCQDPKMFDTFRSLWQHNHWWTFMRSLTGPGADVIKLYNSADIVASCLYPLYARTAVESLACGKPFVAPGYRERGYPYRCELDPESIAVAIIQAWEGRDKFNPRKWAEETHSAEESARQAIKIYERYAA